MRPLLTVLSLLFLCGIAAAETVVVNDEDSVFYYVEGRAGLTDVSAVTMDYIPPGAFRRIEASAVSGFFFVPGRSSHPGLALSLDSKSLVVDMPRTPEYMVDAVVPPSVRAPIRLDNRYMDWRQVPALSQFSRHFEPEVVRRSEEPALFGRGGTDIELFRALRHGNDVYLMISAYSGLSDGFSLLVYGFESDRADSAEYAIQLSISDEIPAVLLWRRGREEPELVGTFVHTTFFLEAVIWGDSGAAALLDGIEFLEVSTAITDAGLSEEFPLSRIRVGDIPREDG